MSGRLKGEGSTRQEGMKELNENEPLMTHRDNLSQTEKSGYIVDWTKRAEITSLSTASVCGVKVAGTLSGLT